MNTHTAAAWVAALFLASCLFAHTVALRLLLLAAGIILAAIVVSQKQVRSLPPVWIPFLLWGTWALASLAWSMEPERTLKEWRNEVFYAGAALWICFVGAQARDAARIVFPVVAAAAVLACLVALRDYSRGWQLYALGWHGGSGNHSSMLLALMPCAAIAAWRASRARWPLWMTLTIWTLVALFFASAYATLNRTVWIGFAVEFGLIAAFLFARGSSEIQRRFAARALMSVIVVGAVVATAAVLVSVQAERRVVGAGGVLEQDHRLALWPEILERVGERPISGYGFGRGLLRHPLQAELAGRDTNLWHAHNFFLEAALQTGLVGLVLLILLVGATLRQAWRCIRQPDEWTAACGIALAALVAGMLVRNMTDTLLVRQNALLYWGLVGAMLGSATIRIEPGRNR